MTRQRFGVLLLVITLAWMTPSIVTGSVFMTDRPIPAWLAADVESARASLHQEIDGWLDLRYVGARCGSDGRLVVLFEARRPFAAMEPAFAARGAGAQAWGGGFGGGAELEREITHLLGGLEAPCPTS